MKYIVTDDFYDLHDGNRRYVAGDTYPRAGLKPSKQRIEELSTDKNRIGRALIAPEDTDKPPEDTDKNREE